MKAKTRLHKLFSLLLCCILLVGLFPMHGHAWDEVVECEYCGKICGDEYICSGGPHCSEESGRSCYEEHHCKSCGECEENAEDWCEDCHMCVECAKDEKCHCEECGNCFVDHQPCPGGCGRCDECVDDWCSTCEMCFDCGVENGSHCPDCKECTAEEGCLICHRCFDCGGQCGDSCTDACLTCHLENDVACEECGACFVNDDSKMCIICHTCADCAGDFCEDCHMCVECAKDEKCHCEECGNCFVDHQPCPGGCGRCDECVDDWCSTCEMCVECAVDKGNHCPDCNECTAEEGCLICHRCFDCGGQCGDGCTDACLECHLENGMACEGCGACYLNDDSRQCSECHLCVDCAVDYCEDCNMCIYCAIDNGRHCPNCESCYEECIPCPGDCEHCDACADDWCDDCGMCFECGVEKGSHCPDCGECTADSGCIDCNRCENCAELCDKCKEHCRSCADICDNCGVCEHCATICQSCGNACSDCASICDDCGLCEECCKSNSQKAGCDHDICVESDEWDEHWNEEHEGEEHKHIYGAYSYDASGHWHACCVGSCGERTELEAHSFSGWSITRLSNCQENGIKERKCMVCGYKETEIITGGSHIAFDWESDETDHWRQCEVVGCGVVIDGTKAPHSATGDNVANCRHKSICDVCGREFGSKTGHNVDTAWTSDANGHWHACRTTDCAVKFNFAEHTPDREAPTVSDPVKCADCGYEIAPRIGMIKIELPFTVTVKLGGNVEPGKQSFELEIFDVGNIDKEGYPDVTYTAVVETNGKGGYSAMLVISGPEDQIEKFVCEGFFVREKNTGAANWTYSDAVWYVMTMYGENGFEFVFYPATLESSDNGEHYVFSEDNAAQCMSFENVYTENKTDNPTDPGTPGTPKTGDDSSLTLWVALMIISGGALLGTAFCPRKRKNEK